MSYLTQKSLITGEQKSNMGWERRKIRQRLLNFLRSVYQIFFFFIFLFKQMHDSTTKIQKN